jgi:hypothetical protein
VGFVAGWELARSPDAAIEQARAMSTNGRAVRITELDGLLKIIVDSLAAEGDRAGRIQNARSARMESE